MVRNYMCFNREGISGSFTTHVILVERFQEKIYTAIFSVVISTTASRDKILRRSPDVEFTSDSPTQLRDVIWIKYISTTTEEM